MLFLVILWDPFDPWIPFHPWGLLSLYLMLFLVIL